MDSMGPRYAALLLLAQLTACGGDLPTSAGPDPELSAGDTLITVNSGGLERTLIVHVPPDHDRSASWPLFLVFHGASSNASEMERLVAMHEVTDAAGVVVAYPQGIQSGWAIGCDCTQSDLLGIDDVAFIAEAIDVMAREFAIDSTRIYATGISQGGRFSQLLACRRSDLIAAVVSVAASTPTELADRCGLLLLDPMPILFMLGTDDPIFLWNGIPGALLSGPGTITTWRGFNGCTDAVESGDLPDTADDGTTVRTERYADCAGDAEVVLYAIEGGGHTWPGAAFSVSPTLGPVSQDVSANEVLTDFFAQHLRQ